MRHVLPVSALLAVLLATLSARPGTSPTPPVEVALRWDLVAPGVWRAVAGTPEPVSLFKAAGIQPSVEGLARMPKAEFPFPGDAVRASLQDGKTVLRVPLQDGEQLYGLGLNFKALQQRGAVKTLRVDHYGGSDNGRTHAPVPFYVSSGGYGVLVDAARYITVYAGTAVRADSAHPPDVRDRNTDPAWSAQPRSDAVEVLIPAAGAAVYVFAGPTPLDAVRRYNLYSGGGYLPPKWGLGFFHRMRSLATAGEALAEAGEFAARGFPLDVVGLEPGWQSRSYPCTYVWDGSRFPDPPGFVRELRDRGVRVNLWLNPYVSPESPIYASLKGRSGSHTVWTGIVPDYALAETRAVVSGFFGREHVDLGVSGYKVDEVDGYDRWLWPDHATFPSGLSGEQMRQVFGLHVQRAMEALFRGRGLRTWGLTRGTNAGAPALPFVIYNDSYSHQEFITALASGSFIGALWTPEVRSSASGEEWLRRMQSVCFSPLALLNAWSDGTKPWSFPEVADAVGEVMQLRAGLLPYFYGAFARYHFDGTPPFRAMALVDGFLPASMAPPARRAAASAGDRYHDAVRRDITDQYMAGDSLLVAPMFAGDSSRAVVLPAGKWYDFYTGAYVGAGEAVTVAPGLDRIPLFVRDGGLIPMIGAAAHVPGRAGRVALEVRHYGEADGQFLLYDDDGETFEYEAGQYSWTRLSATRDASGTLRGNVTPSKPDEPFGYGRITWTMMPVK